jgi:hypothetical protein
MLEIPGKIFFCGKHEVRNHHITHYEKYSENHCQPKSHLHFFREIDEQPSFIGFD